MAVVTVKSAAITNAEATPAVANTAAQGAAAYTVKNSAFAGVTSGDSATSAYYLVRIPSKAVVEQVFLETEALGAGCTANIALRYSETTTVVGSNGATFFASAVDVSGALAEVNKTNESGHYPIAERNLPIWDAAGLTSDPGGTFDVCVVLAADAAATGNCRITVEYLVP